MVELATGKYPYPVPNKETGGMWDQLTAIVDGKAPSLPADKFSKECCDFVDQWYKLNYLLKLFKLSIHFILFFPFLLLV